MLWGIYQSLRGRLKTEVAFFTGNIHDAILEAKNYAIHHRFEIAHVSAVYGHNLKDPGKFTLIVTYKTKS